MNFLEKDLEQILWDAHFSRNIEELDKRGLYLNGRLKRQLNIGSYGVADLVSFEIGKKILGLNEFYSKEEFGDCTDSSINAIQVTVYEIKKDKIGISAFLQALRYVQGIKQYIKERQENNSFRKLISYEFKIVLIGKELDNTGSFCFIPDILNKVDFYTYKYGLDGITFQNESGYRISPSNFKFKK